MLLATLYAAAFVAGFNENLVNMALMSIMAEYGVSSVTAQWLVTGYMIVATVVVTCMAFLFRRVKLRTLFFAAAGLSLVGSFIGLFAPSFPLLMVARLVQACGTGIFIPLMMSTVTAVTPKNRLGTYMSIGGCMITFGPAFSPVVCGALVTVFGWHSVFMVPIVAMVVLIVCGALFVTNLETQNAHLDVPSVVLSAVGLSTFVYSMAEITTDTPRAVVALAVAAVAIGVFAWRQMRCDHPLIDLTPLKKRRFVAPMMLVFMGMMTTFSMSVLLPLYFEGAAGMSAFSAGFLILIPVLANAGFTLISGRIMDKRGEWPLLPLGFALIAAGLAVLIALSGTLSVLFVVAGSIVIYMGVGMILSPSQTAGMKNLPPEQNAFGVTLMTTMLQIAACIGPSLFVGVMNSSEGGALDGGASEAAAVATGFSSALTVAIAITAVAFVVAFVFARSVRANPAIPASAERPMATLSAVMETEPYTIPVTARVEEAIRLLMDRKVSGMPVVDGDGKAVGFVSDGDIMRYLAEQHPAVTSAYSVILLAHEGSMDERLRELIELPVSDIATESVVSVPVDTTLEDACALLAKHRFKKVPVVDDGRVVGTVNRSDILRFAMKSLLDSEQASGV